MKTLRSLAVVVLAAAAAYAALAADPAAPAGTPAPAVKARGGKSMLLMNPEKAVLKAPSKFRVFFKTTKGDFAVEVRRDWSPNGADRFYNLVKAGFYNDAAFFRAIEGFMVQFGINGSGAVNAKWKNAAIQDDPPAGRSNARGMISFATAGPNTRTTQLFINYGDNSRLDSMGFTPFAKVVKGLEVVDGLYKGYGEGRPSGLGPEQERLQGEGNAYLRKEFPKLDYIKTASLAH